MAATWAQVQPFPSHECTALFWAAAASAALLLLLLLALLLLPLLLLLLLLLLLSKACCCKSAIVRRQSMCPCENNGVRESVLQVCVYMRTHTKTLA